MSSYFDALSREVAEAALDTSDDDFLDALAAIECRLFREVAAATGDREAPCAHCEHPDGHE